MGPGQRIAAAAVAIVAACAGLTAARLDPARAESPPVAPVWAWGTDAYGTLADTAVPGQYIRTPMRVGTGTGWTSIAAAGDAVFNYNFSYVVKADGTLWRWGVDFAMPAVEIPPPILTPTQFGTDADWAHVSTSANGRTFGIKTNGTLWAWGSNDNGGLGDGTTDNHEQPVPIGTDQWSYVTAGKGHSAGIKTDGTLWVWGYNATSQLGDGLTAERHSPYEVAPGTHWKAVSVSASGTHAIRDDGTLWAWGSNTDGHLGDGTQTVRRTPVQIGSATSWKSVSSNQTSSTDARPFVTALQTDGTMWAWGNNNKGQLADGTQTARFAPTKIGTATDWVAVTAANAHAVAAKSDGSVWEWGSPGDGAIPANTLSPTRIGTDSGFETLATAANHTLARKADGSLWTWGYNWVPNLKPYEAQLLPMQRTTPGAASIAGEFTNIEAGRTHVLARKGDGTVWAWGNNSAGWLGDGSITTRELPVQVGSASDWSTIAAGPLTSFGIKTDGTLWGWGDGGDFRFGSLNLGTRTSPILISADTNWKTVAAGWHHTLGIRTDGTLWSWGKNGSGQLGTPGIFAFGVLTQVGAATNWSDVVASDDFSLGIRSDGTLWAWGDNANGQLGDPTFGGEANPPAQVGTATNWKSVDARANHVVATKTDGTLWAWGDNTFGAVGTGAAGGNQTTPVQIGSATNWTAVAAGEMHTIALRSDGTAWSWGDNTRGALGDGTTTHRYSPGLIPASNAWLQIGAGRDFTVALSAPPILLAPAAPTGVTATADDGAATVSWTAANDNGSPVTGYTVTATPGGAAAAAGTNTSVSVPGLTNGVEYTFTVRATNAHGDSPESGPSNAVTPAADIVDLAAPIVGIAAPTARITTTPNVPVAWFGNDPSGIGDFSVRRTSRPWNSAAITTATWLPSTTATTGKYPGTYGRTYCFSVRAQDTLANLSGWSPPRCTAVPLRSDQLLYSSGWKKSVNAARFGGMGYVTTKKGAIATRTSIVAKRLYVVATKCSTCGTIQVRWKGKSLATISLKASVTTRRNVIAIATFTTPQSGTLTVTNVGANGKPVVLEGVGAYNS